MTSFATDAKISTRTRSLVQSILGIKILGTGSYLPENRVANEDLAELGYDAEWIIQRTGIKARRHAFPGQSTSDLAFEAAQVCLKNSGVAPSEVDFIFVATMTPDHYTPSSASLLQASLGCQCPAVDMNGACSGFMYALITACQFLKTGCCKKVLVVGADVMSTVVDPEDKKTFPLFGDGAGAAILSLENESTKTVVAGANGVPSQENNPSMGILAYCLGSEGELANLLVVPGCGSRLPATHQVLDERDNYLKMEGRAVFKWAVRLIPEVTNELLSAAGLTLDDIDLFIFHQANRRIIDSAVGALQIPLDKVLINVDEYGNTSAASIPISLDEALQQGRIQPGHRVLLCGFGAGLSSGACIWQF